MGEEVTNATKVLTEAAGQLTAAVAVLSAKVSPKLTDQGTCKDNCLASVKSSPTGAGSPFHGFSSSEVPSAAASEVFPTRSVLVRGDGHPMLRVDTD